MKWIFAFFDCEQRLQPCNLSRAILGDVHGGPFLRLHLVVRLHQGVVALRELELHFMDYPLVLSLHVFLLPLRSVVVRKRTSHA